MNEGIPVSPFPETTAFPVPHGPRPPSRWKKPLLGAVAGLAALFIIAEIAGIILMGRKIGAVEPAATAELTEKDIARLPAKKKDLERKLAGLAPRGSYIVIDSGLNILTLRKGGEIQQQAVVSCGSGDILQEPNGKRSWVFDTPRGEFAVKSKLIDPDWIKPDWAFIEEGETPPKKFEDRVDTGMLGDYALGFGNGYFIHGTLYTRLLGRNVTHGCIRVGDKDLEAVFKIVPIGAKIYIF
jgi:lipoprotein-anchoring transpeptidase ErfK/SrfK